MAIFVPNKDSYVRLEGVRVCCLPCISPINANNGRSIQSGKVLAVKDNELCHVDKEPVRAEQWWQLVPIKDVPSVLPGIKTTYYVVKNVTTGRVLWCRTKKKRAGVIDSNGKFEDNQCVPLFQYHMKAFANTTS
jgi:hypothetical protein